MGDDNDTQFEKLIGRRVRRLRTTSGLSSIALGSRVGISFQQVQKYEKGATHISVLRFKQIADALARAGVPGREERTLLRLFRETRNSNVRSGVLKLLQGVADLEHARSASDRHHGCSRRSH